MPWRLRCAVLLLLTCTPAGAEVVDRVAASVNDTAIPESQVRKAMVVSALTPEPGESAEAFRARVLDALIDQHLEYEDAVRFGPAAPDATEIRAAMDRLGEKLKAEGKDPQAEFAQAGLTPDDVRALLERQLVIARYLRERFAPIAYADDAQAREEYEKNYVPEQKAAGQPAAPFDTVEEQMRQRASERAFDDEVARWLKDLRLKARIAVYRVPVMVPDNRTRVVVATAPPAVVTPAP